MEDKYVTLLLGTHLTLSYVWGIDSSPLVSTTANVDELYIPYSLAESPPLGKRLPQTIQDAMKVSRELEYRYLWADRLCIIQGDEVNKSENIAAMATTATTAILRVVSQLSRTTEMIPAACQELAKLTRQNRQSYDVCPSLK